MQIFCTPAVLSLTGLGRTDPPPRPYSVLQRERLVLASPQGVVCVHGKKSLAQLGQPLPSDGNRMLIKCLGSLFGRLLSSSNQ